MELDTNEVVRALEFTANTLNTIPVSGIQNLNQVTEAYRRISEILKKIYDQTQNTSEGITMD